METEIGLVVARVWGKGEWSGLGRGAEIGGRLSMGMEFLFGVIKTTQTHRRAHTRRCSMPTRNHGQVCYKHLTSACPMCVVGTQPPYHLTHLRTT